MVGHRTVIARRHRRPINSCDLGGGIQQLRGRFLWGALRLGDKGRQAPLEVADLLKGGLPLCALWKGSACSITSIRLEREEGAEPQKHDGSWNDRAGGLTNSAGNCGQAGWEKHSCKATEDGKPAKDGHKHRPFLRPAIVSARNGKSCDEQEDAGHKMSAGSRETCSASQCSAAFRQRLRQAWDRSGRRSFSRWSSSWPPVRALPVSFYSRDAVSFFPLGSS